MAKRPGHVEVVTEVGYCNFCNRSRNLRREEHHLGGLVRTIVSCETCHRTLSSSMGVAGAEPEPAKVETAPEPAPKAPAEKPKRAAPKKAAAKKPAAKKVAAKPKTPPKPRSSGTRKSTRSR
jgi:hypothetical protein